MKNLIISTEAACDIPENLIKKYDIRFATMKFLINGVEFKSSDSEFSTAQVCKFMKEGASSKTSQVTEYEAEEYFSELLKEEKDILHISFTSAMSSTYDNFKKAAENLNRTSKNKIYVVDSLCQAGGLGLIIKVVAEKIDTDNLTAKEGADFAEQIRHKIVHYFTVDDLKYLARGGRISSTTALIGNIVKIKPVLHLNDDGAIVQLQKVFSRKKALSVLIDKVREHLDTNYKFAIISEADCEGDAKFVAEKLKEEFSIESSIVPLSPVICSHSGPGTLALFFVADKRG